MQKETTIYNLIQDWQKLRSDGWKMVKDTDKLIEKHMDIEEAISKAELQNAEDAFLQLKFLYTLWWASVEKPAEGRDYIWLNVFSNVLGFLNSKCR